MLGRIMEQHTLVPYVVVVSHKYVTVRNWWIYDVDDDIVYTNNDNMKVCQAVRTKFRNAKKKMKTKNDMKLFGEVGVDTMFKTHNSDEYSVKYGYGYLEEVCWENEKVNNLRLQSGKNLVWIEYELGEYGGTERISLPTGV